MIAHYNFDISHFTGQGWNKNNFDYDSFTNGSYKKRGKSTAKLLIALRGRKCEKCGCEEWLGQPINLQVHHIDGDRRNNELDNLMLLCPNCHSYTDSYCNSEKQIRKISDEEFIFELRGATSIHSALLHLGLTPTSGNYTRAYRLIEENNIEHLKNKDKINVEKQNIKEENNFKLKKERKKKYCKKCGKEISHSAKEYCEDCSHYVQRKVERPSRDILKNLVREKSFLEIGRIYGVSDNAIRKWCIAENIPSKKSEIKNFSDEEWSKI